MNGIKCKTVNSWNDFSGLLDKDFSTSKSEDKFYLGDYVWRGHPCEEWKLLSSFDREFRVGESFKYNPDRAAILRNHLNSFVYAARGKLKEFGFTIAEIRDRIKNQVQDENHIWALGQHYGLKTPLLDWSYSPYVAAYFASEKLEDKDGKYRVVWGLNYKQVCDNYVQHKVFNTGIKYFDLMSSEHPRLINQRGLFTIINDVGKKIQKVDMNEIAIESIVKKTKCSGCNNPWLIKIKFPKTKKIREDFLWRLNAMNINQISLFPEIEGAAEFCNIGLEIREYARFHGQTWQ